MAKKVVRVSGFDYLFFSFPFSFLLSPLLFGGVRLTEGEDRGKRLTALIESLFFVNTYLFQFPAIGRGIDRYLR